MGESSSTLGHFVAQIIPFNSSKAMKIGGFPPQFAAVFVGTGLQATLLFGRCWVPRSAGGTVDVPLKMRGGMVSEPSFPSSPRFSRQIFGRAFPDFFFCTE